MGITERRLRLGDLAGCVALSRSANWNQNEADWRLMLELGHGWGVFAADGTLAASTLVLPYGGRFAWVSMVLVLPAQRRKGYARKLLRVALGDLLRRGLTPILDATPAGREVYVQQGFRDAWTFSRLQLSAPPVPANGKVDGVRPFADSDWPAVRALDVPAFGASREPLLRALAARLPAAALVCERAGRMVGYLLGRDGREAHQLGPLVAEDEKAAWALLAGALERVAPPLYVDVVAHAPGLRRWLEARGFVLQRPFTRMVHGAHPAPGDPRTLFLVAGPELG
jgi:GNAT superfamily N-acetyltransferase